MGLACALEDAVEDRKLLVGVAPGEPIGKPLRAAALDHRGRDCLQAQIAERGQQVRSQRRAVIDDRRRLQRALAFAVAQTLLRRILERDPGARLARVAGSRLDEDLFKSLLGLALAQVADRRLALARPVVSKLLSVLAVGVAPPRIPSARAGSLAEIDIASDVVLSPRTP
jgi:hypothetical protein